MIPNKLHYCWFGKNQKSESTQYFIDSWRRVQPDFEIIEWNEENFDIHSNPYVKIAYENKKWAFVSDYVRAYVLYNYGGFYLDTDMEMKMPLNEFMKHRAVCGFEIKGVPFSSFWGVEKKHPLSKDIKEHYENAEFSEITNTSLFSRLLVEKYGARADQDEFQELKEGIALYPSNYFSLNLPVNYVSHHFSASWHETWNNEHKSMVNTYGVLKQLTEIQNAKQNINNVIVNHGLFTVEELLDKFPTRSIISYLWICLKRKIGLKQG